MTGHTADHERTIRRLSGYGPLDWSPLRREEVFIDFDLGADDDYFRSVAYLIRDRPDIKAACGDRSGRFGPRDLECLRFFPDLRRIDIHEGALTSLEGLGYLSDDATEIAIGSTRKPLSLLPLGRFRGLRTLYLERQHRGIEIVGELRSLEDLTLRSVTLPNLSVLLPLEQLRSFDIKLGGTTDLRLLPRIGRLTYLELWLIRGLEDVDAIGDIVTLEELYLQGLKRVTHLPSFRRLGRLRKVHLETMRGLADLSGVAEAPALEILWLTDFRHAQPDIARPFIGHPTLRETGWGLGSLRKNFAAQDLVPLDPELKDRESVEAWIRDIRARIRREAAARDRPVK